MDRLTEFINQTWFRTDGKKKLSDPEAEKQREELVKAQEKAVSNLWDLPFSFNIALEEKNIERTSVNAQNLLDLYKKEIAPPLSKLDSRLKAMAELDWIVVFYRALEYISRIHGASADQDAADFAHTLALSSKFDTTVSEFYLLERRSPENIRMKSFDDWLEKSRTELVVPQNRFWKRAERTGETIRILKASAGLAVIAAIIYVIASIATGTGPIARRLGIHYPKLVAEEDMTDLGDYAPVKIADFNASSILLDDGTVDQSSGKAEGDVDGHPIARFTDANLMDGNIHTAWAEGEKNAGYDKRLYFNVDAKAMVHYIVIYSGNQESEDSFKEYNRPKAVTLRLDSANKSYRIHLKDTPDPQYIRVDETVDRFWIIIDSVYRGSNGENTTCVSEVEVY